MKKTRIVHAGGRGGAAIRKLHVKVKKKAGSIKQSSRLWLERQLNDPYVNQAKSEGLRSRAAFKLKEIHQRYPILKKNMKIIDLGAAPGGWCQIAAKMISSDTVNPNIVAIDYLDMEPISGVIFLKKNFLDHDAPQLLIDLLKDKPDLVMSDMAAPTTGHRRTDHLRTMYLCETAADFAIKTLKLNGHFLTKTFQGGTENDLLALLKRHFKTVHHIKPPSSRAESVELYLLAMNFKGENTSSS